MKINIKNIRNYILLGICGVLAVISIVLTIDVGTSGAQIAELTKKETLLTDEKNSLENQLVKTVSLGQLEVKGSELGFTKPTDIVYVTDAAPVANIP